MSTGEFLMGQRAGIPPPVDRIVRLWRIQALGGGDKPPPLHQKTGRKYSVYGKRLKAERECIAHGAEGMAHGDTEGFKDQGIEV
jgi:hypothetical protein